MAFAMGEAIYAKKSSKPFSGFGKGWAVILVGVLSCCVSLRKSRACDWASEP